MSRGSLFFFFYLMATADEVEIILIQELSDNISSKRTRDTSIAITPSFMLLIRIRPKQITKKTVVRNLSRPLNLPNLLQILQLRRQPPVHTQDLVVDEGGNGQTVEAVGEYLPQPDVEPPFAFVVEAVYPVDLRVLVVASQEEDLGRVADFVSQEEADRLEALLASVDVVAEEEVVG